MKYFSRFLALFALLFLFGVNASKASHIPGANITYTCNPSNPLTYTFTLTIFRTCPGTHPATMSASYFSLTNTCGLTNPVVPTFNQVGVATDVNQLCSSATSNCSGGTEPGVWKYTYEAVITLPANCDSWTIGFDLCCRDAADNLTGGTGNNMACSTTMNTQTAPCNSSPVVTAQPIPYACTNTTFNYCLTTMDPEGDSVYYQMVNPAGAGQAPIAFDVGYSLAAPLNNFTFDPNTGCISFNHPLIGQYVIAVQIHSYDNNGNLIGTVVHDFKVIVMSCTNSPPQNPSGGISNFSGTGSQLGPNTVAACYGDVVCFDVVFEDPVDPGNTLTIIQDGTTLLPGATFTQTGTNPVTGTFCWTSQPGYTSNVVTFIAEDDGCPVMGTTGFAVTFNITTGVYAGPDLTICGAQSAQLQGNGAGTYTWTPSTGLSCTNCPNPVATPSSTTTYTVTGNLTGSCSNTDQVTVNVVPDFPLTMNPASATICANEIIQLNANGPGSFAPYTYLWTPASTLNNDTIANPLAQPITSTTYYATVTAANGCTKTDSAVITVSGIGPTVTVTPSDTDICAGQSVNLITNSAIYPVACGISAGCSGTLSSVQIGNSTSASSIYSGFYGSTSTTTNYTTKVQYIFTAAELNALGYFGGTIRSFSLYFTTISTYSYDNVNVWMGCTSQSEYTSTSFIPTSSLTQVAGPVNNFNPVDNNWQVVNIADWDWDGTSNIVIQICSEEDNAGNVGSSSVRYSTTSPAYRCVYDYSSTVTSCNEATGSRTTVRPNIIFDMCVQTASSPTYSWTPSAGLNNPNIANPTATPSTTTAYVLDVTSNGCTGSVIANVNVGPNYTLNPTASPASVCLGDPITLSANPSGAGPYTQNWSPAGAFSNPNAANPTLTPTGTTTYYVATNNGGCNRFDSVTVTVGGLPTGAIISDDTVCQGDIVNLNAISASGSCGINYANCSGTNTTGVSGTNTTASSTYGPFYGSTAANPYQFKRQYIYTAAELTAMGFSAGTITQLELDVSTSYGRSYDNMEIWIGCVPNDQYLTSSFIATSSLTQVYSTSRYTTSNGWNAFNITGYDWDGISNICVQFCGSHQDRVGGESVRYTTTTPAYRTMYYSSSTLNACGNATGSRVYYRPNTRFTICNSTFGAGATYSWSPSTSMTSPNSQSTGATVYGPTTYQVTVTDPAFPACPTSGTVNVYIDNTNSVTASNDTVICAGDPAYLNSNFVGSPLPILPVCGISPGCSGVNSLGDVGATTTATTTYSPFYGSTSTTTNYTKKLQFIYTAAELTSALGFYGGTIRDIALYITTTNSYRYDNLRIWIGCTSQSDYTNTTFIPTGSLTQVYGPVNNFDPTDNAWNTFNITDFDWDGTSNIVVQFCCEEDNVGNVGSNSVRYHTTSPAYRTMYDLSSTVASCNELTGSRYTSRANMRFNVCEPPPGSLTYTWTPNTNLSNPNIANPTATPSANTTYVVQVSGGVCDVYDTVDVNMCLVLPIELLAFKGKSVGKTNVLSWSTASEINNDYFTVERSSDGVYYQAIGRVNGAGNTNVQLEYALTDYNPLSGINYYRLRQTDFDGNYSYSDVIALNSTIINELTIYPNPGKDVINIEHFNFNREPSYVKVIDVQGRVVINEYLDADVVDAKLDISMLNSGLYFIQVTNAAQVYQGTFSKK